MGTHCSLKWEPFRGGKIWCLQKTKGASATNIFWAIIFGASHQPCRCSAKQGLLEKGWANGCLLSACCWATVVNWSRQMELPCSPQDQAPVSKSVGLLDLKIGEKMLASESHKRKNYKGHVDPSHHPMMESRLWLCCHVLPYLWLKLTSNDRELSAKPRLPGDLKTLGWTH